MTRHIRRRFWLEAALSTFALVMMLVTLWSEAWIEEVLHIDPDGGSGALEWTIVVALAAVSVACGGLARREVSRHAPAR